jgi:lysophospholipase L1-like esterase
MTKRFQCRLAAGVAVALLCLLTPTANAQPWVSLETHTRYLAIGDSISAGYGAMPVTQGFVYDLYQSGAFDDITNMLFCNMAVPGATSQDVLQYQVPQARLFLADTGQPYRKVITLTVGGNDMLQVLGGGNPATILQSFGTNLGAILAALKTQFPGAEILVSNYYDPKLPVPDERTLVMTLNQVIATAAAATGVTLVDIFSAFDGRSGLLLIEKKGSAETQIHPTNAGYRAIAQAFKAALKESNKR